MQPGDVVADRFTIEKLAGVGSMGAIYRAIDGQRGVPVALKILQGTDAIDRARFAREAHVLSELRHPGIVRYIAQGLTETGKPYLVMEWLDGEDLSERLSLSRLSIEETVALGRRVAGALAVAHARGVVHRDIKPSNLFLPGGEISRVTVLDFGIARMEQPSRFLTLTGKVLGTPAYMAPEQARGAEHLDARADVFALGCVLFECLTGRQPFEGTHPLAVLAKILFEEAPRVRELLSDVPEALDALVERMLYKDIAGRPADGAKVAAELASIVIEGRGSRSSVNLTPSSVRSSEPCLVSVVLAGSDPTRLAAGAGSAPEERLLAAALRFSARLEHLADGSSIAILGGHGSAPKLAGEAARFALAMRAALPAAPMVLATERGVLRGRLPVGAAIDRAVVLLDLAPPPGVRWSPKRAPPLARRERHRPAPIHLDETTAALLDARFDVAEGAGAYELRGERESLDSAARTLLGRPTPCVGRDRELSMLEAMFEECVAEPVARAALITGAAGIGKSRLRHELMRNIRGLGAKAGARSSDSELGRERDRAPEGSREPPRTLPPGPPRPPFEVWIARGDPLSAGSPLGMVARLLRRAAGILDGEPIEAQRGKLRARVELFTPKGASRRVAAFLGELLGIPFPDQSEELVAARRDALLMGEQLRLAWEELVSAECAAHPLVIILEDLHWGDLSSVQFIDATLRRLHQRPLFLLALGRPEVHDLFPRLWPDLGVQELRLGELSRRAGTRLVRQFLGDEASPALVDELLTQSEGNAFQLEELIRAAAEGRAEGRGLGVAALVQARLATLPAEARRMLRAASVFGLTFWSGGLRALLGDGPRASAVAEWIEELLHREVIIARRRVKFPGEEEYSFHHALVRDAAYGMLAEEDLRLGHRLAAAWLEKVGESDVAVLAEHLERAGEAQRAAGLYLRAAELSLFGNDFAASLGRARHGAACGGGVAEGELRGALLLVQAEANKHLSRSAEAEACAAEAMRSLERGSLAWFSAVGELAVASGKVGKPERLVALSQELLRLEVRGAEGPYAIAAARVSLQLLRAGQGELGGHLLAAAEAAAAHVAAPDPMMVALVERARAIRAMLAGDLSAFLLSMKAAADGFERIGARRSALGERANVAYAYLELGAYAEAEAVLRELSDPAARMGLGDLATAVGHNLALALAHRGAFEEALLVVTAARDAAIAGSSRRIECLCRMYRATILLLAGDAEAAAREAHDAIEIPGLAPPMRAYPLGILARALLARGSAAQALAAAEKAMAIIRAPGSGEEGELPVHLAHIEALLANELTKAAEEAIATARDRLLLRASRISDPGYRESFLTRVPDNARILELSRAWLREDLPRRTSAPPSLSPARSSRPALLPTVPPARGSRPSGAPAPPSERAPVPRRGERE